MDKQKYEQRSPEEEGELWDPGHWYPGEEEDVKLYEMGDAGEISFCSGC